MRRRTGILFVCLGNICRSPMARMICTDLAQRRALLDTLELDSCGTGHWHVGGPADPRAVATATRHGLDPRHIARQVDASRDFARFDLLIAMDRDNRRNLLRLGAPADRVRLMRSFDAALRGVPDDSLDVPDPYEGGADGFETVYSMLTSACEGLLDHVAFMDKAATAARAEAKP